MGGADLFSKDKPFPILDVIPMANQLLLDFVKANPQTSHTPPTHTWSPPTSPPIDKINFGGAVFKEIGEARLGVIIPNLQGWNLDSNLGEPKFFV